MSVELAFSNKKLILLRSCRPRWGLPPMLCLDKNTRQSVQPVFNRMSEELKGVAEDESRLHEDISVDEQSAVSTLDKV